MKTRYIIGYVLLLVLPALLIGLLALRWLRHEDERLQALARTTLEERAAVLAGHIDLLVREVLDALQEGMARLPDDPDTLDRWVRQTPLAHHAFMWSPPDQLILPDAKWATPSERAFLQRYDALFSGRRLWPDVALEEGAPSPLPGPHTVPATALQSARRDRAMQVARYEPEPDIRDVQPAATGVLPWFWERDLYWLLWRRSTVTGQVRGLEIEHLAVYARFVPFFVAGDSGGTAFALYNHLDERVIATPDYPVPSGDGLPVSVWVSEWLPNWHVRAIATRSSAAFPFGIVSGLLVAILLVAILSGGGWMCRQGWLNHRDATQKTTFVSNVSHELKTPLTTIRMYAEMLKEGRIREPRKQADYLRVIESESRRLTRLVNNVLDFSRLEQRRRRYTAETLPLADLLREVIAAYADRFDEVGTQVHLTTPDNPALVRADRDALEQVFLNLLDNAAKYAPDGKDVHVTIKAHDAAWGVEVADRGPGIPDAHAERVFTSFHRMDDSLTRRVSGAGLGLSIGRRLMRDMGGDLCYRPRQGGGAIFEMVVPDAATGGATG